MPRVVSALPVLAVCALAYVFVLYPANAPRCRAISVDDTNARSLPRLSLPLDELTYFVLEREQVAVTT